MNDVDLKRLLDRGNTPELGDAARERIVSAAVIRYRHAANNSDRRNEATAASWLDAWFKPLVGVAAAIVLVVTTQFVIRHGTGGSIESTPNADLYNAAVFDEYASLFRDELRAVVAHNGGVDVVLGNRQVLKANPVVLIRLEADSKPVYITAYSGQTIETKIGGRTLRMEILTTSDRRVLVASDEFMLERGVLYGPETYRADARVLEARL